jgi:hypothetical protein
MPRKRVLAAAAVLAISVGIGVATATSGGGQSTQSAQAGPVNTAAVERGSLASIVSQYGTLNYRGRPDGSPYAVVNHLAGTFTMLRAAGESVGCGGVLYRVNNEPVVLLCGAMPAYRSMAVGDSGPDVAELNANLARLGYLTRARAGTSSHEFTAATASALERLQARVGADRTGALALGQAVFLPVPIRLANVSGELGGSAQPGARVAQATSGTLEVEINLDPSQQRQVHRGDRVEITLPDNTAVAGHVARLGRVAQSANAQDPNAGATIPAYISLDHPRRVGALDQAPVQVAITTRGVENALSIPVTAIVGRSGGGLGVEVVGTGGRRRFLPVTLGLFDTAAGRVQVVHGDLHDGDQVVVPAS